MKDEFIEELHFGEGLNLFFFYPFSNARNIRLEKGVKSAYAKFAQSKFLWGLLRVREIVLAWLGSSWGVNIVFARLTPEYNWRKMTSELVCRGVLFTSYTDFGFTVSDSAPCVIVF